MCACTENNVAAVKHLLKEKSSVLNIKSQVSTIGGVVCVCVCGGGGGEGGG